MKMESQLSKPDNPDISVLLTTWGYGEEIITKFKDEGIEVAHLKKITEYSLEKLFPKIGERTTFMNHIESICQETPAKKARLYFDSDTTSIASTSSASNFFGSQSLRIDELLKHMDGRMISSYYKTENKLNDFYRQKLADIIIREELQNDINKSFPNNIIEYWSNQIVNYFTEESYEVWAGCTKGKNRESAAGRGVLLSRYYNMRRKLIKVGAILKTRESTDKEDHKHTDDDTDNEHDDLIRWLNNTKTVNLVSENWDRTTAKRLSMLKGSMEIHNYMDAFPAIKCFDGYRLLETDFKNLYPDAELQLYGSWPALASFIISKIPNKEKNEINDCFTPDGKKVKTIRALALLFPIKNIIMKKKKQWRPSRLEIKDGLFQYVKSVADIQPTNLRKKEKFYELGLNLGPQLYAVSPDEDNITECYMIINATMYNIGSPLKAFDIFFKSFHALNSCYPKEVEREMHFLQTSVYNIHCDTDKKIRDARSSAIMNEYNKFKSLNV